MVNQQINEWQNIKAKGMFNFFLNNWIDFLYAVIETIGMLIALYLLLSIVYDEITTDDLLFICFPFFIAYMAGASTKILMKWARFKKNIMIIKNKNEIRVRPKINWQF